MEKVSDALYEFEGIKNGISKRTMLLLLSCIASSILMKTPIIASAIHLFPLEICRK